MVSRMQKVKIRKFKTHFSSRLFSSYSTLVNALAPISHNTYVFKAKHFAFRILQFTFSISIWQEMHPMSLHVPTTNVIQRVIAISSDQKSMGSALAYPVDDYFCMITAAHVVKNLKQGVKEKVFIYKDSTWLEHQITPYFHAGRPYHDGDVDIAVLVTSMATKDNGLDPYPLSSGHMVIGQDAFF